MVESDRMEEEGTGREGKWKFGGVTFGGVGAVCGWLCLAATAGNGRGMWATRSEVNAQHARAELSWSLGRLPTRPCHVQESSVSTWRELSPVKFSCR